MRRHAALLALLLATAGVARADEFHFVTLEFPPLIYATDDDQVDGAAVEIVREVMKRLGHTATIEIMPWSRSLAAVKAGKADAIFTAYKNPEREAFLDYGKENLVSQVLALYAKKDAGKPAPSFGGDFKTLKDKVFGTLNTISYGTKFDTAKTKLKLKTERVETLDLNFKKLVAGRLDYVISNRYSAEVEIETLKMRGEIVEVAPPVEVTPSYIAFTKKKSKKDLKALRTAFDKQLALLKASGRYQEILDKYRVRAPVAE